MKILIITSSSEYINIDYFHLKYSNIEILEMAPFLAILFSFKIFYLLIDKPSKSNIK